MCSQFCFSFNCIASAFFRCLTGTFDQRLEKWLIDFVFFFSSVWDLLGVELQRGDCGFYTAVRYPSYFTGEDVFYLSNIQAVCFWKFAPFSGSRFMQKSEKDKQKKINSKTHLVVEYLLSEHSWIFVILNQNMLTVGTNPISCLSMFLLFL